MIARKSYTSMPSLLGLAAFGGLLLPLAARGQVQVPLQPQAGDPGVLTLRSSSRLTLVDVTVLDKKGQAMQGLKPTDFHVFEDGKEQPISHFDELRADTERPVHEMPKLPPNIYTNLQPPPNSSAVNLILMDALNTKLTDQAFVRNETLAYLKDLKPGTRVAIMTLSSQLRLLQGFTQDGSVLAAAVKSKNNRQLPSPLLNTDLDDSIADIADVVTAGTASALQEFSNEQNSFQTQVRNQMTLEALDQIAGYLATVPGRKNLIWFTSGMPLSLFPQGGVNDLATATDYTKDLRKTTDLLTAAQVAVYPVDAQGVHGDQSNNAVNAGHGFANGNGATAATANMAFLQKTGQEQLSMVAVAEATGGVAYFNTNGLKEAIGKAISNGANYYTISYVPPVQKLDGSFHKISVKVDQPGAKLAYRTGYYSDDIAHNKAGETSLAPALVDAASAGVTDMAMAMRRGVPNMAQIVFDAQVVPDTGELVAPGSPVKGVPNPKLKDRPMKRYNITYAYPARQIDFAEAPEHMRKSEIEYEVAAFDVQGNLLTSVSQTIKIPLREDDYTRLQKGPMRFFQQLDLPPGDIFVRIGVHDVTADKIGTIEIPLAVTKKSTAPAATK